VLGVQHAGSPKRSCRSRRGRFYSMLCLPFSDPDATLRHVETFGDRPGVGGFMVTTVRNLQVNDNAYMRAYRGHGGARPRALLPFRPELERAGVSRACNRFLSVHALGFTFYNILHCTNWVINGMCERFPQAAGDLDRIRPRLGAVS